MPKCVSSWYATNVVYKTDSLIPIPLGIAPYRNSKSAIIDDFIDLEFQQKKRKFMYFNFNLNTNYFHRTKAIDFARKIFDIQLVEDKNYQDYLSSLALHQFSISPWGNGIDTHRFWESLYSGSIPITKQHLIYNSFPTLPKILVEDYEVIDYEFLIDKLQKLRNDKENYNFEELDFKYWKKRIQNDNSNLNENNSQILINHNYRLYRFIADFKHVIKSKLKVFNRLRRLIYRVFKV